MKRKKRRMDKIVNVIVWHDNGAVGRCGTTEEVIRKGDTIDGLIEDYSAAGITVYAVEILPDVYSK